MGGELPQSSFNGWITTSVHRRGKDRQERAIKFSCALSQFAAGTPSPDSSMAALAIMPRDGVRGILPIRDVRPVLSVPDTIPAVWLHRFHPGYKLPLWRWILLPATTFMFHRNQGVWVSGNLQAGEEGLTFAPVKLSANKSATTWTLQWSEIHDIAFAPGIAMDRITIRHETGTHSLQSARSGPFFERAKERIA